MENWVETAGISIRDVCDDFFAAMPALEPFTLPGFVGSVGRLLGRRIEAVATTPSATLSCGGLVSTPQVTVVWYPATTSVLHQGHVLLHEVAHLVLNHPGRPVTLSARDDRVLVAIQQALMPDVPIALIRRVLHRNRYEEESEQHAEQFATIGGPRLHRLMAASGPLLRQDRDVQRLRPLFAVPAEAGRHG